MIKAEKDVISPGGRTLILNAANNGVGLPKENPNLSKEVQDKVEEVYKSIKSGSILISKVRGSLI